MQNIIKQIVQEPKKKNQRMTSIQSHEVNYSIMWLSITSYGAIDISDRSNPCPIEQVTVPGPGDKGRVCSRRRLRPGETAARETAVLSARCRDGDGSRGPQQIIT